MLRGDFDIEIEFDLLDVPAASGVRAGLVLLDPDAPLGATPFSSITLARATVASFSPPDQYRYNASVPGNPAAASVATADLTGALRLTRSGSNVRGFYRSNDSWIPFEDQQRAPDDDLRLRIGAWGNTGDFASVGARVALDNFIVRSGNLVCPPAPVTCSETYFEDDFNGTELDPARWQAQTNGYPEPAIEVRDGAVHVGGSPLPSARFPYVESVGSVIPPTGDFEVEVAMTYTRPQNNGTGFRVVGTDEALAIWQDLNPGNVEATAGGEQRIVFPALSPHVYRLQSVRGVLTLFADDVPIASDLSFARPNRIWFGNPAGPVPSGLWSAFQIDSVRVRTDCNLPTALEENFDGEEIGPGWNRFSFGSTNLPSSALTNGRLEIFIPATATGDHGFGAAAALSRVATWWEISMRKLSSSS